jgi:hypothetical protein
VQPDEPAGVGKLLRERLQRDARSVRCQQSGGLHARLELRVERLLGFEVLEDGFDDHVRILDARAFHVRLDAPARIRTAARVFHALFEQLVRALDGRLDVFEAAILQRDRETAKRTPRRDVPAHDTGADHVHVADRRCAFATHRLEAILQHEHANEIARRLRGEQMRDRPRLGLVGLLAACAVLRPQVDDGVGRRVVLPLCLAGTCAMSAGFTNERTMGQLSTASANGGRCVGGFLLMSLARAGLEVRGVTILSTRPRRSALSARTGRPVSIISIAGFTPMSRTVRTVPPKPG